MRSLNSTNRFWQTGNNRQPTHCQVLVRVSKVMKPRGVEILSAGSAITAT